MSFPKLALSQLVITTAPLTQMMLLDTLAASMYEKCKCSIQSHNELHQ